MHVAHTVSQGLPALKLLTTRPHAYFIEFWYHATDELNFKFQFRIIITLNDHALNKRAIGCCGSVGDIASH